jgi:DHA1 family multidrug resistance protein-like MFS transporter
MAETISEQGAAQTAAGSRRWMIILISAAVAFYWGSLYFYVPTLPVYTQDRIGDLAKVGVVLSMYGLWQAVVRLPLGIIVDWVGRRKPFILLGFALSALGAWMMARATGYSALVAGRAMTGLAAAAWVPLTVLFSSQFPAADAVRATSLLSLVNGAARMTATGMTGTLNRVGGYGLAFYVAVGVAGLAMLVTLPVREAVRAPKRPALREIGLLVIRRDVLLPALLSAVGQYITWSTTFGFLPILARNLGATGEMQSLLVTLNLGIGVAGNLLTSTIARRVGNIRLLYTSFALFIGGVVVLAAAQSLAIVFAAQVLLGLGYGIGYPLCMGMSIEKVDDGQRTTAMGLHQAVYAIGMFAGPWLSGILAKAMGLQPMFWATAAACLVLSLGLVKVLERKGA